jgi:O-antigen/teichoic acid export membrane protein
MGASTAISVLAQFIQLAALARLLTPSEFGLAASALIVTNLASLVQDGGLNNAIIAKRTDDRNVLSSLYWANFLAGGVVAAAVVGSIPLATEYFGEPDLADLLLLAAPASLIAPLGQQYGIRLQKDLHFRAFAIISTTAVLVSTAAAVGSAALGAGATSLIIGYLVLTTVRALLLAVKGWSVERPLLRLRRADLTGYLRFGLFLTGTRIMTYFGSNADYIVIGGILGTRPLGVYSIAYRVVTMPQMKLNPALTRVAFPVFAQRQTDDAALRRGFLELTRLIAFVSLPLMAVTCATAPQLVPTVFGDEWEDSIIVLQILTIAGAVMSLGNLNSAMFLAKDRPDLGFKLNVLRLALLFPTLFVAASLGTLATVAATFAGVVAFMFVVSRVELERLIGMSLASYAAALRQPTLVASFTGLAGWLTGIAMPADMSDASLLVAQLSASAGGFAVAVVLFARRWVADTWRLFSSRPEPTAPAAG